MSAEELIIFIGVIGAGVILIFLVIWFVSTYNRRIYRRFREPAEICGTIVDIMVDRSYAYNNDDYNYEPYLIKYSYYDGSIMHEKSFKSLRAKEVHKLQAGDRIVVYYDVQKPDNAVTALQMEWEKSMWWKMTVAFAIFIIPTVIIAIYVTKYF